MAGNIHQGNKNEPITVESCFGSVVTGYYESPFLTTTDFVTNYV